MLPIVRSALGDAHASGVLAHEDEPWYQHAPHHASDSDASARQSSEVTIAARVSSAVPERAASSYPRQMPFITSTCLSDVEMPSDVWHDAMFRSMSPVAQRMAWSAGVWRRGRFTVSLSEAQEYCRLLPAAIEAEYDSMAAGVLPSRLTLDRVRFLAATPATGAKRQRRSDEDEMFADFAWCMLLLRASKKSAVPLRLMCSPKSFVFCPTCQETSRIAVRRTCLVQRLLHILSPEWRIRTSQQCFGPLARS